MASTSAEKHEVEDEEVESEKPFRSLFSEEDRLEYSLTSQRSPDPLTNEQRKTFEDIIQALERMPTPQPPSEDAELVYDIRKTKAKVWKRLKHPIADQMSGLNVEEQKRLVELLHRMQAERPGHFDSQEWEKLRPRLEKEQEKFLDSLHLFREQDLNALYGVVYPPAHDYAKERDEVQRKMVNMYSKWYKTKVSLNLKEDVNEEDTQFVLQQTLLHTGNLAKIILPSVRERIYVPQDYDKLAAKFPPGGKKSAINEKLLIQDSIARGLAEKHQADIVITSSAMKCLADTQPDDWSLPWQLPVAFTSLQVDGMESMCVFIDRQLPKKCTTTREKNARYQKVAFKSMLSHPGVSNKAKIGTRSAMKEVTIESSKDAHTMESPEKLAEDCSSLKKDHDYCKAMEPEEVDEERKKGFNLFAALDAQNTLFDEKAAYEKKNYTDRPNNVFSPSEESPSDGPSDRCTTYSLWRLNKLTVLVRCGLHGAIGPVTNFDGLLQGREPVHVLGKLEHESEQGLEVFTSSEMARDWISCCLRPPNTKIVRGHVHVNTAELLHLEELNLVTLRAKMAAENPQFSEMKSLSNMYAVMKKILAVAQEGSCNGMLLKWDPQSDTVSFLSACKDKPPRAYYDLHFDYLGWGDASSQTTVPITSWIPLRPLAVFLQNRRMKRMPCTYKPADYGKSLPLRGKPLTKRAKKNMKKNLKKKQKNAAKGIM